MQWAYSGRKGRDGKVRKQRKRVRKGKVKIKEKMGK